MEKHDIVYILKNGIATDEIIYSLRSVEKNFPHNKVWIYGGKPEGVEPDHYVHVEQHGASRYAKVTNTIYEICRNDEITENFWLFNDDFFVMKKCTKLEPVASGTIKARLARIRELYGFNSNYARRLNRTAIALQSRGLNTLCYAVHMPMLINRKKALEVAKMFPNMPMFRCLYGNYAAEDTMIQPDVKVYSRDEEPKGTAFLSTSDEAFEGKAGDYVRGKFKKPSRWEI